MLSFLGLIRHSRESAGWGPWQFTHFGGQKWVLLGSHDLCPLSECFVEEHILQRGKREHDCSLCQPKHSPHCGVLDLGGKSLAGIRTPNRGRILDNVGPLGYRTIQFFLGEKSELSEPRDSRTFIGGTFVRSVRASATADASICFNSTVLLLKTA